MAVWSFSHPNLTQQDHILQIIPAMEFRFASAYCFPAVRPNTLCYAWFRVWGNPAVKLGVSLSTNVQSAFSDSETGWSVYLKKGELRHGSNSEGPNFFTLPQRAEVDVCIKLDRVRGSVTFMVLGEIISRSEIQDSAFLAEELMYFAAAMYVGGLESFCEELGRYDYWEEKKAALLVYMKGCGSILQKLPHELCRCALEYL